MADQNVPESVRQRERPFYRNDLPLTHPYELLKVRCTSQQLTCMSKHNLMTHNICLVPRQRPTTAA
jgi:hypothetical protein